uniref:Protein kinase domain-containing protein n=1 Tax=Steinernema glaseri TaxID=37863 RepID=A0A1I8A216_9BILA
MGTPYLGKACLKNHNRGADAVLSVCSVANPLALQTQAAADRFVAKVILRYKHGRNVCHNGDNAVNFYEFFLTPTISLKLAQRYTNICLMSSNSRGMIFSATDTAKNAPVAIKFLNRTFDSAELAKHTYREISLLLKANHKNIVKMVNLISPEICTGEKVDSFNVYIVLEKVSH